MFIYLNLVELAIRNKLSYYFSFRSYSQSRSLSISYLNNSFVLFIIFSFVC